MASSSPPKTFTLNVTDAAFSARHQSIFGALPVIELTTKDEETTQLVKSSVSLPKEDDNEDINIFKGEESIFKRPMPKLKKPSHRPRKQSYPNRMSVPDHKRNPEKWVKYSLASTSDMTDQSNSAAAFSFLRELEERKRKQNPDEGDDDDNTGKIVFKKPKNQENMAQTSKTFRDRKLCMPAFEFGSKKSKSKKPKADHKTPGKTQQKLLSHLDDQDEDV